jgi:hypothetical protein
VCAIFLGNWCAISYTGVHAREKGCTIFFEKQNVQNLTALSARGMLVLNSMLSIGKKKEK